MLGKLPKVVGQALGGVRAGLEAVTLNQVDAPDGIVVTSPAFEPGGAIPVRFTADGEGLSPPLRWTGVPQGTRTLVLLVEDADSPTPSPLVHAIVQGLPGTDGGLAEARMPGPGHDGPAGTGRNSSLRAGWLPPDPPPGHGPHRYVFQVFALDTIPDGGTTPGRAALAASMTGHVLAKGAMIGVFERP